MATATKTESMLSLPGKLERPDAEFTVIYDGQCTFCKRQMRRLSRWDTQGRIAYRSLHDEAVYREWPQLSKDRLMKAMCLIDPAGNFHWGPEVFRYLSRKLPRMWWLAAIMHIPLTRGLQHWVYGWVARNRYRISGLECEGGTCDIRHQ